MLCPSDESQMIKPPQAFKFNLTGPAFVVDSACSSSLTVLDQLFGQLVRRSHPSALMLGVDLTMHPRNVVWGQSAGIVSSTGPCRTFDARADGIMLGEGVGGVLLRAPDAGAGGGAASRVPALASLCGTASHGTGRSASLTAPSGPAQAQCAISCIRSAGLDRDASRQVVMVECHGTGTALGDPIELSGLASAVRAVGGSAFARPLLLGAIKSNMGHADGAAGMTGLVKILHYFSGVFLRPVQPNLHLRELNPHAAPHCKGFALPTELSALAAPGQGRIAGATARVPVAMVASFGLGGTNGHAAVSIPVPSATQQLDVRRRDLKRRQQPWHFGARRAFRWKEPLADLLYRMQWQALPKPEARPGLAAEAEAEAALSQSFRRQPPALLFHGDGAWPVELRGHEPPEAELAALADRATRPGAAPRLLVTQGAVGPGPCGDAGGTALWAMARSARLEGVPMRCVDLDDDAWSRAFGEPSAAKAAEECLAFGIAVPRGTARAARGAGAGASAIEEALAAVLPPGAKEQDVAVRGAEVLAPRLARGVAPAGLNIPMDGMAPGANDPARSLGKGWLVTGGLGGLGLLFAEQAARVGNMVGRPQKLVLLSRSGRLAPGAALEQLFASASHLSDGVTTVRGDLFQMGGNLRGVAEGLSVAHAAGVAHYQELAMLDRTGIHSALRPKAWGLWVLLRYLPDAPRVLSFNSAAALFGIMHGGAYAAANGYADGLMDLFHAARCCHGGEEQFRAKAHAAIQWGGIGMVGVYTHYVTMSVFTPISIYRSESMSTFMFMSLVNKLSECTAVRSAWA